MELAFTKRPSRAIALSGALWMLGCVNFTPMAVPPPPKPPPEPARASALERADRRSRADAGHATPRTTPAGPIELTEMEVTGPGLAPRVTIKTPSAGQTLNAEHVSHTKIEIAVSGFDSRRLWIAVDDRAPALFDPSKPSTMSDIVSLSAFQPGLHTLLAAAADERDHPIVGKRGAAVARADVWVGTEGTDGAASGPALMVWQPRIDGDALVVDWIVSGIELSDSGPSAHIRVSPSDGSVAEHQTRRMRPLSILGLPPGPVKVAVSIHDAAGTPLPGGLTHIERIFDMPEAARALPSANGSQ